MRYRSKSKNGSKNRKPKNEIASEFIRVTSKAKNHLVKHSIKITNDKGEEVDESLTQTLERLLCIT